MGVRLCFISSGDDDWHYSLEIVIPHIFSLQFILDTKLFLLDVRIIRYKS